MMDVSFLLAIGTQKIKSPFTGTVLQKVKKMLSRQHYEDSLILWAIIYLGSQK